MEKRATGGKVEGCGEGRRGRGTVPWEKGVDADEVVACGGGNLA